jgi:hypothetical protein
MALSPIALFVFNRPWHTRQTVAALQRNGLAGESDLFIYADGPKDGGWDVVKEVRNYVRTIHGFRSVTIVEQAENLGLAGSIVRGVTDLTERFGSVIVLEDDLVVSPYFLRYMNEALERYSDAERVMHVSAYMLPIDAVGLPETFFYRNTSCWGWGTWRRAWRCFDADAGRLADAFAAGMRHRFNIDGSYDAWGMLLAQRDGRIDSWAIRWYASVFLRGGLCLHPSRSLVRNIGNDGTGVHGGRTAAYDVVPLQRQVSLADGALEENAEAVKRICMFLAKQGKGWRNMIRNLGFRLHRLGF